MKMNKRRILAVSLIVCVVAILSLGSLAWFTDKEEVTNTFVFVTPETPEDGFSIKLYETDPEGEETEVGLQFTELLPGAKLDKDPTVENDGAYDEYARLIVTLDDFDVWSTVVEEGSDLSEIFTGFDANWERVKSPVVSADGKSITYTYYYNKVLEPGDTAPLFTGVVIPGTLTNDQVTAMGGQFNLKVEAEAIQADNLPEGVDTAYEAFELLNN